MPGYFVGPVNPRHLNVLTTDTCISALCTVSWVVLWTQEIVLILYEATGKLL